MRTMTWNWMGWTGVLLAGWGAQEARLTAPAAECAPVIEVAAPPAPRAIDLALCLDTSGSMDGLIEAAKHKLWGIVNELARAQPAPRIRVALLTFGNDGHPAEEGWVRVDLDLTADLDVVSQRLFALTTNGGTELVGRVVARATRSLGWTADAGALKLVVVAGNESADQDTEIRVQAACAEAIQRGILVNAIYCGSAADELAPGWRAVAQAADGQFACIDHANGTVAITTPFDAELSALGGQGNATYIPIGSRGLEAWSNQEVQDTNAQGLNSEAAAERAICKNSAVYVCGWDLVDACRDGSVKLEEVAVEELPEVMRAMSLEERRAYVATQASERARIQGQVAELAKKREAWVAEQRAQGALDGRASLDRALLDAIRSQAVRAGFELPAVPQAAPQGANGAQQGNEQVPAVPVDVRPVPVGGR